MASPTGWHTSVEQARRLGSLLLERGLQLAVAESCTGGLVGAALTAVPGSSRYFRGGVIAYHNEVKHQVLGVPLAVLERWGAVSEQTVTAMAEGVAALVGAQCAVAVSGIAGPEGGTPEKPVGLVWIGTFFRGSLRGSMNVFGGDRDSVRRQAVVAAIREMTAAVVG